jgi:hypothetical protein
MSAGAPELTAIRRILATIFLVGSAGTAVELVLLEHTEGVWQNVPLGVVAAGCLGLVALAVRPGTAGLRGFQLVMVLFVASGIAGILLHYQGNVEFELELNPGARGLELFWESMTGATPALAPGMMILLGAVGLTYTYRHPARRQRSAIDSRPGEPGRAQSHVK